MSILEEIVGDVIIFIVNIQRATLHESESLKKILSSRIDEGYHKIIIDLSACEFMDSSFLSLLVHFLKKAVKFNGDLRLVGLQPAVKAMFELTRLYRVFEIFNDPQTAVKSFNKLTNQ
ncbi:MAG: STAS domain-containing protein [bacterium]